VTVVLFQGESAVLHTRHQMSVGQGGFHVAQLLSTEHAGAVDLSGAAIRAFGAKPLRYVYDCGSRQQNRCIQVVNNYIRDSGRDPIDFLFLSHFDDDHVNGIPTLLDRTTGLQVDTIVLPFIDAVERMIAFGRARARASRTTGFFRGLVVNPTEALAVFNPRRIIFVQAGPAADDAGPLELAPSGPDPEAPFRWKLVSAQGQPKGKTTLRSGVEAITVSDSCWFDIVDRSYRFDWIFKPYVRRTAPALVQIFEREAEKNLGWQFGSFRRHVNNQAERASLVMDQGKSQALARAYKVAFLNRNLTSLCLYAGPSGSQRAQLLLERRDDFLQKVDKIGWLGTGDAALAHPQDASDFIRHFHQQRYAVATYTLPHHGAKPNHSAIILSAFEPLTCSVSAKPPRSWLHPHPDVIREIQSMGLVSVHVTDRQSSELHEGFLVFP